MPHCSYVEMYSGYLEAGDGREHHYVYVPHESDPDAPVVFWFNGGPGCSSMIGFIQEHGPCVFMEESDATPQDNPYSWHHNSSIVYMESPAGVGYNKFDGKRAYTDENTSEDNLQATIEFFKRFPELKDNDLYLAGESYAGIYIPWLAYRILDHNDALSPNSEERINLKGLAIGNGVTNWKFDCTPQLMEMALAFGLIDTTLQKKLDDAECDWSYFDIKGPKGLKCTKLFADVQLKMKDIYPYDLFRLPESYYNKDTKAGPLSPKARLETGEDRPTQASSVSKFWEAM
jgi:carboxypeptidase C (cathepsin A)